MVLDHERRVREAVVDPTDAHERLDVMVLRAAKSASRALRMSSTPFSISSSVC